MEREQELEWEAAQNTVVNVDLVFAAKTQLKFLAAIDRNRWLSEGPGLDRAIYRYNACWLPLLAKHSESPRFEGPLVVPFDCEWIWHCHRLNPIRYKSDCEEFYGRVLDNQNVVSSLGGISTRETEEIWNTLYPGEPFVLDSASAHQDNVNPKKDLEKCTTYDLISAVQRQSPFFYQVSRPYMNDDRYLEGAVARYKGFLHLIKRRNERSIKSFSVPTYDIDLIWHTHQLHPVSYCKDLMEIMGKVLGHDDTDSDRTKGQKLDVGFSETTKMFEGMYGSRYWRAGAMYRGSTPSPVVTSPYFGSANKEAPTSNEHQKIMLPRVEVLEVMLEFVGVRNLPVEHKGNLFVTFSKTQADEIFNTKRSLTIFSESGEKQVASFQCEPTGNLLLELMSSLQSSLPLPKSSKTIGTTSIPMAEFMSPESDLRMEKWLELAPSQNIKDFKPIELRVAMSVTVPTSAPYVLHMARSRPFQRKSCLFPLPLKAQFSKSWTQVIDEAGNLFMSLQMRDSKKSKTKKEGARRQVVGIMESGETRLLAEFAESRWSIVNTSWSLQLPNAINDDGHLLELTGPRTVRLYPGGRLDYESRRCEKHKVDNGQLERDLITAVQFSAQEPYGKAVALLDLKSGTVKVKEEWFLLPGLILTFILGDILKKEGYNGLILGRKTQKESPVVGSKTKLAPVENEVELNVVSADKESGLASAKGGGCGGGCGSGCGNMAKCSGGGGCGGSGCGNMAKPSGCGSGCGGSGGCGNMAKCGGSGSCGGSGCGNMAKCGSGGGCGGSGCGNMAKSGGCSGGCGGSGGCGNMAKCGGSGSCGGSGCGNVAKSGGCGGGCGGSGGCGNMAKCGGGCGGSGGCGNGAGSNKQVLGNEILVA